MADVDEMAPVVTYREEGQHQAADAEAGNHWQVGCVPADEESEARKQEDGGDATFAAHRSSLRVGQFRPLVLKTVWEEINPAHLPIGFALNGNR